jgi:hypothetical protein
MVTHVELQLRTDVTAPDTIQTTTNMVRPTAVHLGVLFVRDLVIGRHTASRAQPMLAMYRVVEAYSAFDCQLDSSSLLEEMLTFL